MHVYNFVQKYRFYNFLHVHTFVRSREISVIVQTTLQWNNRASIGRFNFFHDVSQAGPQKLGDQWPHRWNFVSQLALYEKRLGIN